MNFCIYNISKYVVSIGCNAPVLMNEEKDHRDSWAIDPSPQKTSKK